MLSIQAFGRRVSDVVFILLINVVHFLQLKQQVEQAHAFKMFIIKTCQLILKSIGTVYLNFHCIISFFYYWLNQILIITPGNCIEIV